MSSVPDAQTPDSLGKAQKLVLHLLSRGWSHMKISQALGERISARTVYRWAKGEHAPQRAADLVALEKLARSVA